MTQPGPRPTGPGSGRGRRRRSATAAGVVAILVVAVVVPAGATRALGPCYAAGWRGGQDGAEVPTGQPVEDVAAVGGSVWALGDRAVTRVDPVARTAGVRVTLDAAGTGRLVAAGDALWVTGKGPGLTDPGAAAPRLWRIDPRQATVTATVDLGAVGDDVASIAAAEADVAGRSSATTGAADRAGLWVLVRRGGTPGGRLDLVWVDAGEATTTTTELGDDGGDRLPGSPWADGMGLATDGAARAWVEAGDRLWHAERDDRGATTVTELRGGAGQDRALGGLAWASGSLFAVAGATDVVRLDPADGATIGSAPLPAPAAGRLRSLEGRVWVDTTSGLVEVAGDGRVVGTVAGTAPTIGATAGDGSVWVTTFRLDVTSRFDRQRDNRLLRVDPATAAVTGTWVPGCAPGAAVVAVGAVWMASYPAAAVLVVDP